METHELVFYIVLGIAAAFLLLLLWPHKGKPLSQQPKTATSDIRFRTTRDSCSSDSSGGDSGGSCD